MFEQLSIYNYFNCARIFLKKNLFPSGYFELNFNSLHPCIVPPHLSRHDENNDDIQYQNQYRIRDETRSLVYS